MAKNFVQEGKTLTLTAPSGGVTAGVAYVIGALFVIALTSADEGEPFEGMSEGVWSMPKATHAADKAFTEGEAIFWNATSGVWDKTGAGLYPAGTAVVAAASTAAVVLVKITGLAGTAVAG